jgi:hypothetical protein
MRPDMKKVVTERPRGGGGVRKPKGERRDWQRFSAEDFPHREKIRAKWNRNRPKYFTDVLGPLYGFLLGQVGRPWDKVYSEIAQNLPKTSMQNRHIYTHVWQFVEKHVILIDRVPCYGAGRRGREGRPIESNGLRAQLYIHPLNGLLCKAKPGNNRKARRSKRREPFPSGVTVYEGVQYHKLKGVWYEVQVSRFAAPRDPQGRVVQRPVSDPVLGRRYLNPDELSQVYQGYFLATSKRPLTKREVERAGQIW